MKETEDASLVDEYKQWVIAKLEDWRETFDEDKDDGWDKINLLIIKYRNNDCSGQDYEDILFHLWQKIYYSDEEEGEGEEE
jgi:hypothetical protein